MTPPPSDHFNGKTFFFPGLRVERSLAEVLRWKLTSRGTKWKKWIEIQPPPLPRAPTGDELVATLVNHATFLLQTSHGNLLTDPIFSDRCSPFRSIGPKRVHAPGVTFEKLPHIDAVLLSHDHYDHCDTASLRRLALEHEPQFIAPLGHRDLLAQAGAKRIVELDWWETCEAWPGCKVTLTPSQHWTRRSVGRTNSRLWGGFDIEAGTRRVWFVGDSGYNEALFQEIGRRCGAPDLALIPIGAYEPRWFMKTAHMNPEEAVKTHRESGARRSVAMHWGTFQLTDEGRDDPVHELEKAREAAGIDANAFKVLQPGESVIA